MALLGPGWQPWTAEDLRFPPSTTGSSTGSWTLLEEKKKKKETMRNSKKTQLTDLTLSYTHSYIRICHSFPGQCLARCFRLTASFQGPDPVGRLLKPNMPHLSFRHANEAASTHGFHGLLWVETHVPTFTSTLLL